MWAHYADSHKGICLRYRFSRGFFSSNEDDKKALLATSMKYGDTIEYGNSIHALDALLFKAGFWEYENEYRIMLFDPSTKEEYPSIPFGANLIHLKMIHNGASNFYFVFMG